jgi:hypothetical protein
MRVEFEPTIALFERPKTFTALNCDRPSIILHHLHYPKYIILFQLQGKGQEYQPASLGLKWKHINKTNSPWNSSSQPMTW